MKILPKDWHLISDEASDYGSAEINQAKLSSKVEEIGNDLGEVARIQLYRATTSQSETRHRELTLTKERRYRNN